MRLETIRMFSAWLRNTTYGVNAYVPSVPRGNDPAPPLIATWNTTDLAIFNETEHIFVAEKQDPPAVPALYLMSEGPVEIAGEPTPDGQVRDTQRPMIVVIRYLTDEADYMVATRNAEYTLRAVMRSLREMMRNSNAAARELNGICIIGMFEEPALYFPILEAVGQHRITGALGLSVTVRDATPSF